MHGGFSGALDMGDYYLVQNDDGVGTKMVLAEQLKKFDTVGYDLAAMVADDAICLGAEVISISNTIDVSRVKPKVIQHMMHGLKEACLKHKIVIPGGEIAEVEDSVNHIVWNATAVGIVEKQKLLRPEKTVKAGDAIISLYEPGLRSNGFSLVRAILSRLTRQKRIRLSKAFLKPSTMYYSAVIEMLGRFREKPKAKIKGVAHITGGGIPGNLPRILPKGLGAELTDLFSPSPEVLELQKYGEVSDREAYRTWNMGNGMLIISNDADTVIATAKKYGINAKIAGRVIKNPEVKIRLRSGKTLDFVIK